MSERKMSEPTPVAIKKKREEKYRKRDPRSWENVIKATAEYDQEDRLKFIQERYDQLYTEVHQLNASSNSLQKAFADTLREKDREQAELSKSILAKGRLENLCRELQKQNKTIREEHFNRIKEEEERTREIANNFNDRLNTLNAMMNEKQEIYDRARTENQDMAEKLQELCEKFKAREAHLDTVNRQLDLQKKLSGATIAKIEYEHKLETETWLKEKALMQANLERSKVEIDTLTENIRALEKHLKAYESQYTQLQSSLTKSSQVSKALDARMAGYKDEISQLNHHVNFLKKEGIHWKSRWQTSTTSLINLLEQNNILTSDYQKMERKLRTMQNVCRQVQAERATYIKQLKEHNIELETAVIEDVAEEGRSSTEPVYSQAFVDLKQEMLKIRAEVSEASQQQSSVEHEKITAKEELLKILRGELADMRRASGDAKEYSQSPARSEDMPSTSRDKRGKSSKRASRKRDADKRPVMVESIDTQLTNGLPTAVSDENIASTSTDRVGSVSDTASPISGSAQNISDLETPDSTHLDVSNEVDTSNSTSELLATAQNGDNPQNPTEVSNSLTSSQSLDKQNSVSNTKSSHESKSESASAEIRPKEENPATSDEVVPAKEK